MSAFPHKWWTTPRTREELLIQELMDAICCVEKEISDGAVPAGRTLTINGLTQDLSANRTWTVGDLRASNNLSDVSSASASLANLGGQSIANLSNDISSDASSTTKYPSVKAFKDYTDAIVVGLLDDRGSYDASGNVFPSTGGSGSAGAIMKGDIWYISVQGTLGGTLCLVGYSVRALTNTPGQTAGNWDILNVGLGYVPENVLNKATDFSVKNNTKYPSTQAVSDYVGVPIEATTLAQTGGTNDFTFTDANWTSWIIGRVYRFKFPAITNNAGAVTVQNTAAGAAITLKQPNGSSNVPIVNIKSNRWYNLQYTGSVLVPFSVIKTEDVPKNNMNAVVDPSPTDDSDAGYSAGEDASLWFNTVSGVWFVAIDVTPTAAVWQSVFDESGARVIRGVGGSGDVSMYGQTVNLGDDGTGNDTRINIMDSRKRIEIRGGLSFRRTFVSDADYTVLESDYEVVIGGITAARNITLPGGVTEGTEFTIKIIGAATLSTYITILPDSGTPDTIDGGSHYPFYRDLMSLTLRFDGTSNWEIISIVPGDFNFLDAQIERIATGSFSAAATGDNALTYDTNKSYATHIPLFYVLAYGSGTLGIAVVKFKNSVMDLTGNLALVNVTSTQEMSTDNNQAVIHPNSGNITLTVVTASALASTINVTAFGKRR